MPITHDPDGNILSSPCQTIICPVNTVGVMGKGLALDMAKHFKGLLFNYRKACATGKLTIDTLWVYPLRYQEQPDKQILCFPTKEHWKNPSKIEWIDNNLLQIKLYYQELGITSLAMPKIGAGLGKLNWDTEIRPLVYKHLKDLPIPIVVYGP